MKRLCCVTATLCLLLLFAGCRGGTTPPGNSSAPGGQPQDSSGERPSQITVLSYGLTECNLAAQVQPLLVDSNRPNVPPEILCKVLLGTSGVSLADIHIPDVVNGGFSYGVLCLGDSFYTDIALESMEQARPAKYQGLIYHQGNALHFSGIPFALFMAFKKSDLEQPGAVGQLGSRYYTPSELQELAIYEDKIYLVCQFETVNQISLRENAVVMLEDVQQAQANAPPLPSGPVEIAPGAFQTGTATVSDTSYDYAWAKKAVMEIKFTVVMK